MNVMRWVYALAVILCCSARGIAVVSERHPRTGPILWTVWLAANLAGIWLLRRRDQRKGTVPYASRPSP